MRSPSQLGDKTGDVSMSVIALDLRDAGRALLLSSQNMLSGLLLSALSNERALGTADLVGSDVHPGDVGISPVVVVDSLVSLKACTGTWSHRFKL